MPPKYCQYQDEQGHRCHLPAQERGYCYWHDREIVKDDPQTARQLEEYARSGGMLRGIKLNYANLPGINLVREGSKLGYDLSNADLYRANLRGAHLFNINISGGSLMKADLREANIHCANLQRCNLLGVRLHDAKVDNVRLGHQLLQEQLAGQAIQRNNINQANDLFQQAEEIYRSFRIAATQQGIFSMVGELVRKELTMRRLKMPRWSIRRAISKMVDLLCGYGEEPSRVVIFSILLIMICSCLYFFFGIVFEGQIAHYSPSRSWLQNLLFWGECLYYSVVTFTTLGYGDFTPIGISRLIAAIEAFIGSFTIALFVVVFVKKMTR